jgi:hypothetical protein
VGDLAVGERAKVVELAEKPVEFLDSLAVVLGPFADPHKKLEKLPESRLSKPGIS